MIQMLAKWILPMAAFRYAYNRTGYFHSLLRTPEVIL
jgi:hypothetical protein